MNNERKQFWTLTGSAIVLSIVVGALSGVIASVATDQAMQGYVESITGREDLSILSQVKPRPLPGTYEEALSRVEENVFPSIAEIRPATTDANVAASWVRQGEGAGTGIIITSDGWILAQAGDINDETDEIWVAGKRYGMKSVVYDDRSEAVMIKIDAQNLTAVPFGESDEVIAGEIVFAVDASRGVRQTSIKSTELYAGHVVAPAEIPTRVFATTLEAMWPLLPLVNSSGELVALSYEEGAARPLSDLLPFIQSVLKDGDVAYAGLGANVADISVIENIDLSLLMGLSDGALVTAPRDRTVAVLAASPAAKAGLKTQDVITQVNSAPVTSDDSLAEHLARYAPGDTLKLTVVRAGQTMELSVVLGNYADLDY